jgi:TatD DNase family protein
MILIDTHAHLNMDVFDKDRRAVIQRAEDADVKTVIDIGTDLDTSRKALELSQKHDSVYAAVGIHPHDSVKMNSDDLTELEKLLTQPRVIALGEIGLDYHYSFSPPDAQKRILKHQLYCAKELQIPLIIHVREAFQDIFNILDSSGIPPWRGVFHCFGGNRQDAREVLKRGFHISFTGVITFKNFTRRDLVRGVPLDRLLLETDAPYMTPVPHRGKRNEPAFLNHTAETLAEIYELDIKTLADITTANALRLFHIRNN